MPDHVVRVSLALTEGELRRLAAVAYDHGWQRELPRKAWSTGEYKEAARHAVEALVKQKLAEGCASAFIPNQGL